MIDAGLSFVYPESVKRKGTIEDLNHQNIQLHNGQNLTLCSEDLEVDDLIQYSEDDRIWISVINWNAIREIEEIATLIS